MAKWPNYEITLEGKGVDGRLFILVHFFADPEEVIHKYILARMEDGRERYVEEPSEAQGTLSQNGKVNKTVSQQSSPIRHRGS